MFLLEHIQAIQVERNAQKNFLSLAKIESQTRKFLVYLVNIS